MNTLKFHGYSDDTFGEYGVTIRTATTVQIKNLFNA